MLLASYLLDPARYEQNLENVALHYLGPDLAGPAELAGRPLGAVELPPDLGCLYGASRAAAALHLWPLLRAELKREGLWELYARLELPLVGTLARMEARGIGLDQDFLRRFGRDLETEMQRLEEEIYNLAGEDFLIHSLSSWAGFSLKSFTSPPEEDQGQGPVHRRGGASDPGGRPPATGQILEYRTMGRLKSTYVEALLKLVDPAGGRNHTTFLQSVAATGRLSGRDPNFKIFRCGESWGGRYARPLSRTRAIFLGAVFSRSNCGCWPTFPKTRCS